MDAFKHEPRREGKLALAAPYCQSPDLLGVRAHATVFPRSAEYKNITEVEMAAIATLSVSSASIPVAGFKDVYDTAAVEKALQELPPSANEALRALYEKMLRVGDRKSVV